MGKDISLEESVVVDDDGRWIPSDTFMWVDAIPIVGLGFSVYRLTKESYYSLVDVFTKSNGSVSDGKYLSRPFIICIDMLGFALYYSCLFSFFANDYVVTWFKSGVFM